MREIKFRGKCIKTGKWIYGDLHTIYGEMHQLSIFSWREGSTFIVQRKTVGQYIGIKDKNGREIYEGDIIEVYSPPLFVVDEVRFTGEVVFRNCEFVIKSNRYGDGYRYYSIGELLRVLEGEISFEVIGNIYENPELLEQDND